MYNLSLDCTFFPRERCMTYILVKAVNPTNRLSVYNKSDEHEVIYYQKYSDEEKMNIAETMVFNKLKEYREQANRERFILQKKKI